MFYYRCQCLTDENMAPVGYEFVACWFGGWFDDFGWYWQPSHGRASTVFAKVFPFLCFPIVIIVEDGCVSAYLTSNMISEFAE